MELSVGLREGADLEEDGPVVRGWEQQIYVSEQCLRSDDRRRFER